MFGFTDVLCLPFSFWKARVALEGLELGRALSAKVSEYEMVHAHLSSQDI